MIFLVMDRLFSKLSKVIEKVILRERRIPGQSGSSTKALYSRVVCSYFEDILQASILLYEFYMNNHKKINRLKRDKSAFLPPLIKRKRNENKKRACKNPISSHRKDVSTPLELTYSGKPEHPFAYASPRLFSQVR